MLFICHLHKVVASSNLLATKPFELNEHVVDVNMASKGNVSLNNLVQTIVQDLERRLTQS